MVFEVLQQHLDAGTGAGCGLLFCDVDRFKQVNDQHGHAAGDQLLVELASRLRRLAGPDDVVARLGGDEFVLLSPGADQAALAALACRVEAGMRAPVQTSAGALSVGVSVGSSIGRAGEDPDELMARADRAMYGTKSRRAAQQPPPRPADVPGPLRSGGQDRLDRGAHLGGVGQGLRAEPGDDLAVARSISNFSKFQATSPALPVDVGTVGELAGRAGARPRR